MKKLIHLLFICFILNACTDKSDSSTNTSNNSDNDIQFISQIDSLYKATNAKIPDAPKPGRATPALDSAGGDRWHGITRSGFGFL